MSEGVGGRKEDATDLNPQGRFDGDIHPKGGV
jgi:hypothetical protein